MKAPWMPSIRTKIFFGCICLTLVTVLVGFLSQGSQRQLSETTLGIYDRAFISMSYLRSAQSIVLSVSRDLAVGEKDDLLFVDELQSALDALDVARERAISKRGESYAEQLQVAVSDLQARFRQKAAPPTRQQFTTVEQTFDMAVEIYAGDGLRLRSSVEHLVWRTRMQMYLAIAGSIMIAMIITMILSRAIVPSIRHAVGIATAIAGGKLDNRIEGQGPSETGILLGALSMMQGSIAEKITKIESLMKDQASSHAVEIASQHARLKAALNNMTLGLCMFDAGGALLVQNKRFIEMFGGAEDGPCAIPEKCTIGPLNDQKAGSRAFTCLLEDGRTIAVSAEAMDDGGRVATYEDITERQRTEDRLSHMARHDALTGLPNRVLFREQIERGRKIDRGGALAVHCLDLDRFKAVNDTLGHPIGDRVLNHVATLLLRETREGDMVVRLGGDEFAIIQYARRKGEDATHLAERLIKIISIPMNIDGYNICIGASIGIAETCDGSETPDELFKNADLALYQAKAAGRGTFRFFEAEMDTRLQAKRQLEIDLRAALAEKTIKLYYQPLIDVVLGKIVGFEALSRWFRADGSSVPPSEFIPLAEETGLIPELGLWVLDQACHDAMGWPDDIKIAVNMSPLQFHSHHLVADVSAALARSGLLPTRLEIEITESLMLTETDTTLRVLHDLRALGIRISMDDFGTGFSSLSYLRRFPFDRIKIDQSFIRNMGESEDGLAIVRAVIGLGQSLRMDVMAEGVETHEQMILLRDAGCTEMQGYYFSRPQPLSIASALIQHFTLSGSFVESEINSGASILTRPRLVAEPQGSRS